VSDEHKLQTPGATGDFRIPADSPWAQAWKMAAALGVLGLLAAGLGFAMDGKRFAFAWLMGLMTVLTMGLGSVFFVLVQHLTAAGWSVTVRRVSEFFDPGLERPVPVVEPRPRGRRARAGACRGTR
jgi:fatty acid desaturase